MDLLKYIDSWIEKIFHAGYVKHARTLLFLFLFILFLPLVLTQFPSLVDFTETGQIGDTIGGITAPFIGVIAGYLTFLAFHEQYRANEKATKDLEKERFESKFYNFLSLLNTLEINTTIPHVGNYKQAFHFMFYEFKAIAVLEYRRRGEPEIDEDSDGVREDGDCMFNNTRIKIIREAFNIFINGVSSTSTSRMKEYIDGSETKNDYFLKLQHIYSKAENSSVPYLDDYNTLRIKLFDGHRLRLMSFFRMVCKIIELIYKDGGNDKELYLSTLLSLLSEHQIALLKILYVFDKDQNSRFIMTNKEVIDAFFLDNYDSKNNKACLSKFIFSDTLDCTKKGFINFTNNVGRLPLRIPK